MTDKEERSTKETEHAEKLKAEAAELNVKEQAPIIFCNLTQIPLFF